MVQVFMVDSGPDLTKAFDLGLAKVAGVGAYSIVETTSMQECFVRLEDQKDSKFLVVLSDAGVPEMEYSGILKVIESKFPLARVYIHAESVTHCLRKCSDTRGSLRFISKKLNALEICSALSEDFPFVE